jgi:hypothetical protein
MPLVFSLYYINKQNLWESGLAESMQLYYTREVKLWAYVYAMVILLLFCASLLFAHSVWSQLAPELQWLNATWKIYSALGISALVYLLSSWVFYSLSGLSDLENYFRTIRTWIRVVIFMVCLLGFVSLIAWQVYLVLETTITLKTDLKPVTGAVIPPDLLLKLYRSVLITLLPMFTLLLPVAWKLVSSKKIYGHLPPGLEKFNSLITLFLLFVSAVIVYYSISLCYPMAQGVSQILFSLNRAQYQTVQWFALIFVSFWICAVFLSVQAIKGSYSVLGQVWRMRYYRWLGILLFIGVILLVYGGFVLVGVFDLGYRTSGITLTQHSGEASGMDRIVLHVIYGIIALSMVFVPFLISRIRILFLKWTNTAELFHQR